MTDQQSNKPTQGTWQRLGSNEQRIIFDINIPVQVTFTADDPDEITTDDGVFYSFPVQTIDGKDNKISTSAWTLLGELKKLSPLKDKTVQITKKVEKGKQKFTVIQIV